MDITIHSTKHGDITFNIDDADYDTIKPFTWHVRFSQEAEGGHINKYVCTTRDGNTLYLHRLLCPDWRYVDHIDHDGLNNRRSNLRECTNSQNGMNARKHNNCSSKHKGVHWHKAAQKWCAQMSLNGKRIYLGVFDSETDAAFAAQEAYRKHFQDFALNALLDYQI